MSAVDVFLVYKIIKALTKSFEEWDAYKTGVISSEGKILIKKGDRNSEQRDSFTIFDNLMLKVKKMIAKAPGNTKFNSYAAAMYLVSEDAPTNSTSGIPVGDHFAGARVFRVKPSTIRKSLYGKHPRHRYDKYLDEDDDLNTIRNFSKSNPKAKVILQNSETGEMVFFKNGRF